MITTQKLIPPLIATLVCWLSVGLVVLVTSAEADIRNVALGIAVFVTAVMWASWASTFNTKGSAAAADEKAKRQADPNVALLLELMSEDERRAVKTRLMERLHEDGETSSLDELLDEQRREQRDAD